MSALALFNTPPVPYATFAAKLADLDAALTAILNGGPQSIAGKNAARAVVEGIMRKYAAYVESQTLDNLEALLSSGFTATSNNTTSVPLETPTIISIANETTQELVLGLQRVKNGRAYEVRVC